MEVIKNLFDKNKDIYRSIEKVITYGAAQEARLQAEISEYVVTESIEEQLEKLLTRMQTAMDAGGENDVGVWVSGFYGSGKSSLTKYLGLALDPRVRVQGAPFLVHLQNRLHKPQTKALLATVAKRFPAAVVMLDLASEMVAGATMEDVSTVLYYKVLQWAGFSRNLKVAAFERKLQQDGRFEEFTKRIHSELGVDWPAVQNDPLVVDSLIPEIAHQMYPELFKTPTAFSTETGEYIQFENERVKEMIEIVRQISGKQYILFIIDEVGQYVGSRQNLILNLDGLAKNLKSVGEGKVWIVGTAQQTLTEDDPRAAFNSPELYKLKDRFPIQIDLESSDVKEICYRRLLGKSPDGEKLLGKLFDQHGQGLRHLTKLQDARYYDSDFSKTTFVNLYPFLPAHFDILLHLLGALAKSTGGIGLRSAIKVIQDILIEGLEGQPAVAEQPVGWLATTVTLFDALEKDIRRAFPSIHRSVGKVLIRFPSTSIHQEIAKTVAVLQILGNLPVTRQNVTSLMHPEILAPSRQEAMEKALDELIADPIVPFGEQDGSLRFFSEKLNDIEQERAQVPLRSMETRRILNETLREVFSPPPAIRLHGSLAVTTGIKAQSGSSSASLLGEREPIQTVVELVDASDYETYRTRMVDESRHRNSQNTIYLLGRTAAEIDEKVAEIYRCREIGQRYRNEPDQEIKEYCNAQGDRAGKLFQDVRRLLKRSLCRGSLVFRGQTTAVESVDHDLLEACKKHLGGVAEQVFERYAEAPVRVDTNLAERFLRLGNLTAVTTQLDPLSLVQVQGGTPKIRSDHKALVSIRDYLDRQGTVEGKQLIDHFTDAPFGWSPDTLRYLMAALLISGEIKLKVAGREVTVNGQQAIDALKTNNSFKPVGVSLRLERPSTDTLARASQRLTKLIGDTVIPLEDEISKMAAKHLPTFQMLLGPLGEKLATLELLGADRIRFINQEIADLLFTDASEAPQRFGSEECALYESLEWAIEVAAAFKRGLEQTIHSLQQYRREILGLPESGIPGQLRQDLADGLAQITERLHQEDFFHHAADLSTQLTHLESRTQEAAKRMSDSQRVAIKSADDELHRLPEWMELTQEEQSSILAQLEKLQIEAPADLTGLKRLINQDYVLRSQLEELKNKIVREGRQRQLQRLEDEKEKAKKKGVTKLVETVPIPACITRPEQLDGVIGQLRELKNQAALYSEIELTIKLGD